MTPQRAAIVFVAALLAIAGSAWLSTRRHLDRSIMAGELVLPALKGELNAVTQVRLRKAGNLQTTLVKIPAGWMVAEREYAADSSKVRKLLLDLASLEVIEEKTHNPANYPAIGVQDLSEPKAPGTLIEITATNKPQTILLGTASGMKSVFVRTPPQARSLLVTPRPSSDAEPAEWLDKALITLPERRIKQANFSGPAGTYSISRDKADQANFAVNGVPKNRELASDTAGNASAAGLDTLSMDDVRKPAAASADAAHATFVTFDGLTVDAIGHAEGERRFVAFTAKSSTKDQEHEANTLQSRFAGHEFEIPVYKYDAIFRPLEELLAKPPEPKAKAGKAAARGSAPAQPTASPANPSPP